MAAEYKTVPQRGLPLVIVAAVFSITLSVGVSAPILTVQAQGVQQCLTPNPFGAYPRVAYGGVNYLVLWNDIRSPGIYGTRVTANAVVLDPDGIPIGGTIDYLYLSRSNLAFDGTNYLVAWKQETSSPAPSICARRVSAAGVPLDADSIVLSSSALEYSWPELAFGGENYLVVWADVRGGISGPDVYGARVSRTGQVLDPDGIAISAGHGLQRPTGVAFDGTNYLVTWSRNDTVYAARVTTGGVVIDADGIAISSQLSTPSGIAFDGQNYLVVWTQYDGTTDVYGSRVSKAGEVLDPDGIPISTAINNQTSPRVAFDGTNYLVVWHDTRNSGQSDFDIYGARVSTSGVVLDTSGIVISGETAAQYTPDVSSDGTNCLVVWEDLRHSGTYAEIYAARVSKDGVVLDPDGFTDLLFTSVSAIAVDGYVDISWQVGVEALASSFSVQRSESRTGEFLALDLLISRDSRSWFSCSDHSVLPGKTYWYRIVFGDPTGGESYGPIEVRVSAVPASYASYQSYPNPFNPVCTIRYDLPRAGTVRLQVFAATGELVRTLVDGWRDQGERSEIWDGRADDGRALPSGVYFYSIKAGDFVATKKMVLLK